MYACTLAGLVFLLVRLVIFGFFLWAYRTTIVKKNSKKVSCGPRLVCPRRAYACVTPCTLCISNALRAVYICLDYFLFLFSVAEVSHTSVRVGVSRANHRRKFISAPPSNRDFSVRWRWLFLCGSCRCRFSHFSPSAAASNHKVSSAFCRCAPQSLIVLGLAS